MSKFIKANFNYSGGYLVYFHEGFGNTRNRDVVARFKYKGPFTKGTFLTELIKNHSPAEYFEAMKTSSPLEILKAKNPIWYENKIEAFKKKKGVL